MSTAINILVKGPGWYPGTPRLGDPGDIPEVSGRGTMGVVNHIIGVAHYV